MRVPRNVRARTPSSVALIVAGEPRAVVFEKTPNVADAGAREGEVLGQVLRANDDSGRSRRRKPELLALVELGILERREPSETRHQRGREPFLSMKSRWARTALTSGGTRNGSFVVGAAGRDGFHGSSFSSSASGVAGTPSTRAVRTASLARTRTRSSPTRSMSARNCHCCSHENASKRPSTNRLCPTFRG